MVKESHLASKGKPRKCPTPSTQRFRFNQLWKWYYINVLAPFCLFRSGPVLWAVSTHLDKYLVEKYFKNSNVAVLLIFTALIGLLTLPFIWFFSPQVANLSPMSAALMAFSGMLYMSGMLFYLRALQSVEASAVAPFYQAAPRFGYVLGYVVLGEALTPIKMGGGR